MCPNWKKILKLDKSCISNPKFRNFELDFGLVQFEISDLGFEMQDLSDFKISTSRAYLTITALARSIWAAVRSSVFATTTICSLASFQLCCSMASRIPGNVFTP